MQHDRALLGVGAEILTQLKDDCTVTELWERIRYSRGLAATPLSFDWFILALTFLYAIAAIDLNGGVINVRTQL